MKLDWKWSTKYGAMVAKVPKGWQKLFGRDKRQEHAKLLKVVSIVYDWKLYTDGDYERQGGDF